MCISTRRQFYSSGKLVHHEFSSKEVVSIKVIKRFALWDFIKSTRYQPLVGRALHLCQDTAEIRESYGRRKGAYEGSTNLSDKIGTISRKGNRIALISQVRPPPLPFQNGGFTTVKSHR